MEMNYVGRVKKVYDMYREKAFSEKFLSGIITNPNIYSNIIYEFAHYLLSAKEYIKTLERQVLDVWDKLEIEEKRKEVTKVVLEKRLGYDWAKSIEKDIARYMKEETNG